MTLPELCPVHPAGRAGQRFLLRQVDGLPGPAVKMILDWPAIVRHD